MNIKVDVLSNDDGLLIGKMNSAQRIKAAIRKEVPDVHPIIETLALCAASTTASLSTAVPVFKEAMDSPVHADAFQQFAYLLIDNSVAAVYKAARLLNYSGIDTRRALIAAGKEAFALTQEGIAGMAGGENDFATTARRSDESLN